MTSAEALPLSWARTSTSEVRATEVALPGGKTFVASVDVPTGIPIAQVIQQLRQRSPSGVVIKGAGAALAQAVTQQAGRCLLGHSACIPLAGYRCPHKVRNLSKKARGQVEVAEVAVDDMNSARFAALDAVRSQPGAPRIEHVYRTSFREAQRAFVASAGNGLPWAGVVTLTHYARGCWHVEQLARHPDAPAGTMERLLELVIATLQSEGAHELNLGEVPLVYPQVDGPGPAAFSWREHAVRYAAPALCRLVADEYNIRGLYQFKNKFQPRWEERYFCAWPALSLWDVFRVTQRCGIAELVL